MNRDLHKKKLHEEKDLLESELSSIGRLDKETGEWQAVPEAQSAPEADVNDLADRAEGFEERSATTNTLESRLLDVQHALSKIENNTYSTCEVCHASIEEDRLEANPAARTCKECMDKQ